MYHNEVTEKALALIRQAMAGVESGQYASFDEAIGALTRKPSPATPVQEDSDA